MVDYKQEIINTRKGCLGSSDGRLLAQVATMGYVPKSARKRLAIVKGLIEPQENVVTNAMRFGDIIENTIFEQLALQSDKHYLSNPLWVSKEYGGHNFKLITHPDIVLEDEETKTLYVYEVKTTKENWKGTRDQYKGQLYIHHIIAREKIKDRTKEGWKTKLMLVTYDTNGLDLTDPNGLEFDPDRMKIGTVRFINPPFNIKKALKLIDEYLDGLVEYYDEDEVNADLLPVNVKTEFDKMITLLAEIKQREKAVEEFKQKLYDFMVEKEIKSVKNDEFTITRIDATESKSVDYKAFFDYYANVYPRKARRYAEQYAKMTKRKGYAKIAIKNKTNG